MANVTYQVNELFTSIQGEGMMTGSKATFIRLQGCTVGCPWCDSGPLADQLFGRQTNGLTRNTWAKGGKRMTIDEIVRQVDQMHVVITGGEPTLYDLDPLLKALRGHWIQLETSGQQWLKGKLLPDWITWSPKENLGWTASSHYYFMADEVKFVVDANLKFGTVLGVFKAAMGTARPKVPYIVLMPEGCPPSKETIEKAMSFQNELVEMYPTLFQYIRFGDRLQYRLGIR